MTSKETIPKLQIRQKFYIRSRIHSLMKLGLFRAKHLHTLTIFYEHRHRVVITKNHRQDRQIPFHTQSTQKGQLIMTKIA